MSNLERIFKVSSSSEIRQGFNVVIISYGVNCLSAYPFIVIPAEGNEAFQDNNVVQC